MRSTSCDRCSGIVFVFFVFVLYCIELFYNKIQLCLKVNCQYKMYVYQHHILRRNVYIVLPIICSPYNQLWSSISHHHTVFTFSIYTNLLPQILVPVDDLGSFISLRRGFTMYTDRILTQAVCEKSVGNHKYADDTHTHYIYIYRYIISSYVIHLRQS